MKPFDAWAVPTTTFALGSPATYIDIDPGVPPVAVTIVRVTVTDEGPAYGIAAADSSFYMSEITPDRISSTPASTYWTISPA